MDTLADYVLWMGDFPIAATGFREADALVLCALSYVDFSPLFQDTAARPRLADSLSLLESEQARALITGSGDGYLELLRLAAQSRRYGELCLSDYVDILRTDPALQFAALCFHDEQSFSFLAYRGTDSSLAGWREDFMIAVERTEAQELAYCYTLAHIEAGRRWYIGGHSKGGNLALYAASRLRGEKRALLERVFVLDGPGLCPEVLSPACDAELEPLVTRILPRFAVVGRLFEPHVGDTRIVRSSANGLLQHSVITWGIDHGGLALAPAYDPTSIWLVDTVRPWVQDLDEQARAALIDELFEALSAGGAAYLEDLAAEGRDGLEAILRRLVEFSAGTKRSLGTLPLYALRSGLQSLRERFDPAEPGDTQAGGEN